MSMRLALLLCLAAACGPGKPPVHKPVAAKPEPAPARPKTLDLEPLKIKVVTDPSTGAKDIVHYDARILLDRGNEAIAEERYADALAAYDQLLAEFPDSTVVPLALLNAGLAHESRQEWDLAVGRYRKVAGSKAPAEHVVDALMRIGVVDSERKRWGDAAVTFEQLLGRTGLTAPVRIEAMARLGYVLVEQKAFERAERVLEEAVQYAGTAGFAAGGQLDTDYYVAMACYYLANIPHRQALATPLRLEGGAGAGEEQLKKDLAAKRDLLKLAYDRYLVALKRRNAYWATAAGYQMSQMFKELWDEVVRAPIPPRLTAQESGYYAREVHRFMRDHLDKAMRGHSNNVVLAEAYRTSTEWSEASRVRAKEITEILLREAAGELVVPGPDGAAPPPPPAAAGYLPGRVEL